ncbi:hypothetical protein L2E82_33386 [Cichorium intybus]|uniref:Uncharacterized protein n=1 Tax=Cichorium intybus TaxID=13427 RepID=A0ACB9BK25_CICIN|nr:hypothetical protein L2E82_33386 [Cichorium intybus]
MNILVTVDSLGKVSGAVEQSSPLLPPMLSWRDAERLMSLRLSKDMSSIEDLTQEVPKRKMQRIKPLPREVDMEQGIQPRVLNIRDRCTKKDKGKPVIVACHHLHWFFSLLSSHCRHHPFSLPYRSCLPLSLVPDFASRSWRVSWFSCARILPTPPPEKSVSPPPVSSHKYPIFLCLSISCRKRDASKTHTHRSRAQPRKKERTTDVQDGLVLTQRP